jgi:hypothetical protein
MSEKSAFRAGAWRGRSLFQDDGTRVIQSGGVLDTPPTEERTPCFLAFQSSHADVVCLLVQHYRRKKRADLPSLILMPSRSDQERGHILGSRACTSVRFAVWRNTKEHDHRNGGIVECSAALPLPKLRDTRAPGAIINRTEALFLSSCASQ